MSAKRISAVTVFALFLGLTAAFGQQATVKEDKLTLRTYPFSDPDPMPLVGPLYPYFRFQGYSLTGKDQEWKMVTLENPFLKVLVAPEIGGKVWGAREKSTNRPFIYWNRVVKFREIALRGPWTSGGIEFNFGIIGHAPTTATPVDYLCRENDDGSVSCIVGAMDLPSRTYWRVNIRLPKDAAYVETECFWYNPTPLHDSLYHWMTAAEDVGDDLKYYYPGTHYVGHGGQASPWPMAADGRDLSYYRNNDFGGSKSYHILGEYSEYFGGYWEKGGFGYGHWAVYDDKPGMKLWIWSLARDGEIWRDLLTDKENKQYTEPQTGLLYNQAAGDSGLTPFKHVYFAPQSVMRWKEIWFPVKDIGGMVAASPDAVLNVTRDRGKLRVGLCPLQTIDDDFFVRLAGEQVYVKHLNLKPLETFIQEVDLGGNEGEIAVSLGDEKLRWTSGNKERDRLSRPLLASKDFDWTSAEGLYVAGEESAKQRSYAEALAKFLSCLEKEPGHVRALTRVAELYFKRAEYDQAKEYARRALAVDAYDAGTNFVHGVINRELDNAADAKDGFGWAARSLEFRSAAYEQLAEICLLEKNLERAADYAGRALDYNRYNLEARQVQAIIARLKNNKEAAFQTLGEILRIDPLSHFTRFETYLLEPSAQNREAFTSLIRNELPHETYLELGLSYVRLGLGSEASQVLEMSPADPMIHYWLAYLFREKDSARSWLYLKKASEGSPQLVFPSRLETLPVLRWAAAKKNTWKTSYYLGLILWNLGRDEEAKGLLEGLAATPDWSPFYLARAKMLSAGKDRQKVLGDIQKAIELDKASWRAWRALTDFYDKNGEYPEALRSALTIYKKYPEKPALAMDYAKALLHNGTFRKCLDVCNRTTVLPYEGAWEGRDLFRRANLYSAVRSLAEGNPRQAAAFAEKAKLWPEHLGVGKPFDVDERLENYLLAAASEKIGDRTKALPLYQSVAAATQKFRTTWDAVDFIGAIAFRKLGKGEEAVRLLDDWRGNRGEDNPVFAWASAKYYGDEAKASEVLKRLKAAPAGASWDIGTGDRYFPLVLDIAEKLLARQDPEP
jgi:tetratricopeptide (TPR) repeat protein